MRRTRCGRKSFASGSGSDLNERILLVARVFDDQQVPGASFDFRLAAVKFFDFLARQVFHVATRVLQHLLCLGNFLQDGIKLLV